MSEEDGQAAETEDQAGKMTMTAGSMVYEKNEKFKLF